MLRSAWPNPLYLGAKGEGSDVKTKFSDNDLSAEKLSSNQDVSNDASFYLFLLFNLCPDNFKSCKFEKDRFQQKQRNQTDDHPNLKKFDTFLL